MITSNRIGKAIAILVILATLVFTGYKLFLAGRHKLEETRKVIAEQVEHAIGKPPND